jgi:hypothetical protein
MVYLNFNLIRIYAILKIGIKKLFIVFFSTQYDKITS